MQHWALHKVRMANSTLNYINCLFSLAQLLNCPWCQMSHSLTFISKVDLHISYHRTTYRFFLRIAHWFNAAPFSSLCIEKRS